MKIMRQMADSDSIDAGLVDLLSDRMEEMNEVRIEAQRKAREEYEAVEQHLADFVDRTD